MKDSFDTEFRKRHDETFLNIEKAQRNIAIFAVVVTLVQFAFVGFLVWVGIKLLQYFNVI